MDTEQPRGPTTEVIVRYATQDDESAVLGALHALLIELGGSLSQSSAGASAGFHELVGHPELGSILVALPVGTERGDGIVGVMTISVQHAIRTGGPYALIQELLADLVTTPGPHICSVGEKRPPLRAR